MPKKITVRPNEEGTIVITATYKDHAGSSVTPQTMVWKLTDVDGNVVNSRSAVTIAVPTAADKVVLSGDDLPTSGSDRDLILTLEGTYNHSDGAGLKLKESVRFTVNNMVVVT